MPGEDYFRRALRAVPLRWGGALNGAATLYAYATHDGIEMRPIRALLLLPLFLALHPHRAVAQARGGPVPYLGAALGGTMIPEALAACSRDARAAGEVRAGLSFGQLAVEARGSALLAGFDQCLILLHEEVRMPGIHPAVEYPFERGDAHAALELRVRHGLPAGLPLVVAVGAGWLAPQDVPYVVASAGYRTRGRVRLALDVDQSFFRVPFDVVAREYGEHGGAGPALSSNREHDWRSGLGIRAGVEIPLR